jgi:hypothetical protein
MKYGNKTKSRMIYTPILLGIFLMISSILLMSTTAAAYDSDSGSDSIDVD